MIVGSKDPLQVDMNPLFRGKIMNTEALNTICLNEELEYRVDEANENECQSMGFGIHVYKYM